jgi:hypothetical protein
LTPKAFENWQYNSSLPIGRHLLDFALNTFEKQPKSLAAFQKN